MNPPEQSKTDLKPIAYSYIRFSTPEQSFGDSQRRQFELTERYCRENGLILSDDNFHDKGISGFRGLNKSKGAQLARFLKLCDEKKIKNGSVLICEHIDRITREPIFYAFQTVESILKSGIKIVTLNDGKCYSKVTINQIDMICLMLTLFQSHEESVKKQSRLRESWNNKRKEILSGKNAKLSQIPHWLKKSNDGNIVVDEEKSNTIIRIFDMFVNQKIGTNGIHRILNKSNVPIISNKKSSKYWHKSYITKILKNKSVTGYTEFYELNVDPETNKKKRVLINDSLTRIYPQIISDEMFESVQIKLKDSSTYTKGRIGIVNLFSPKILKCVRCNGPMIIVSKTKKDKWIKCSNYNDGRGCDNSCGYPYYEFENSFIKNVKEIDFIDVLTENNFDKDLLEINNKIENLQTKVTGNDQMISNLLESISQLPGKTKDVAINKIKEINTKNDNLSSEILDLKSKRENIKSTIQQPENLQQLVSKINLTKNENSEINRLKIKTLIHEQVEYVEVYSYRIRDDFRGFTDEQWDSFIKKCKIKKDQTRYKKLRAFRIKYKFLKESRLVRGVEKYYKNASVLIKNVYEK